MARIPTVGTKGVHTAQLSPRLRKIEARRTRKAAQRAYAPELRADREALAEPGKAYRTQVGSVKGATNIFTGALAQALAGLKGSGLKGRYLQQTKSELLGQLHDAASYAPYLIAEAGETRNKEASEARRELLSDRAQMQKSGLEAFNSRLKELRGTAAARLKEQQEKKESEAKEAAEGGGSGGLSKSEIKALESAAIAVRNFITEWKGDKKAQEAIPLQSGADWAKAAKFIASKNESATPADVAKVLKRVRERWTEKRPGFNEPGARRDYEHSPLTGFIPPR